MENSMLIKFRSLSIILPLLFVFLFHSFANGIRAKTLINLGEVYLTSAIFGQLSNQDISNFSLTGLIPVSDESLSTASPLLQKAYQLDFNRPEVQRAWGSILMIAGNHQDALALYSSLPAVSISNDVMLYLGAVRSYYQTAEYAEVVKLYRTQEHASTAQVYLNDLLAFSLLETSKNLDGENLIDTLQQAHLLRPIDLYLNLLLAKHYKGSPEFTTYYDLLQQFTAESILPTDQRFWPYVVEAIPVLIQENLWDMRIAVNALSYMTWQHYEIDLTVELLENLIAHFPEDPEWYYYLAETYQRRGDSVSSRYLYLEALNRDNTYAKAYLALGRLAEKQWLDTEDQDFLRDALSKYEHYHELNPKDFLGENKLLDMTAQLTPTRQDILRAAIAEFIPLTNHITLGQNLIRNSGFENSDDPSSPILWRWRSQVGPPFFGPAFYSGGIDNSLSADGKNSLRIDGLWALAQEGVSIGRSGYMYWREDEDSSIAINLNKDSTYLLSFMYRTSETTAGTPTIWLTSSGDNIFWQGGDYLLPKTNGEWHRFVALGSVQKSDYTINFLLRLYGAGTVLFDDVFLAEVQLDNYKHPLTVEPGNALRIITAEDF